MHEHYILNLKSYLIVMDTRISVLLKPIGTPRCKITVGDQSQDLVLDKDTWVELTCSTSGTLKIEHHGKADKDPITAVLVEEIKFNGITDPKFVWSGMYYPTYPKHLTGDAELKYHNYLSWNGVWVLDFTLPIYTWIHKTLDLGWIYD